MALKIIRAQMKQRRDTAANWAANNPVLLEGELGLVLDHPNSYKVGDGSTPWNNLPLRGFDGNIVQELGDSSTSVISQAGISGLIAEQNAKLAQLDQEWQEIKEANFVVNVEVAPHIEKVIVEGGAAILQPDKLYMFGEVAQIALDFAPADDKYAAQYAFQFKCPADAKTTITMPDSVRFPVESDNVLTLKERRTYQVTIVNGLGVATSWEV